MIKNLFALSICTFLMMLGMGLSSCQQEAPNLDKKERDTRLIGTWTIIETAGRETLSGDKKIIFNKDGSCIGFHYPGGKRLFHTEGNYHLFIFVYGKGAKVSNWTYDDYYQIEGEKLYLWSSKEDMNARKYESAITYIRKPNS